MAAGRHRWGRILLVLALVIVVLLIAADRIGVVVAQREVANQARKQLTSEDITISGQPAVTIHGVPFLTQVAAGHYGKITIDITDPTSKGIRLDSLHVTATDVDAPTNAVISGNGQIEAAKVVGTGQLDWTSFEQMVDTSGLQRYGIDPSTLHIAGTADGKVSVSAPVSFAGAKFTLLATGTVAVTNDVLHVKVTKVTASDSTLPPALVQQVQQLEQALAFDARIPALPYHLVLDSVTTNATGVAITASAKNVVLGG